MCVHIKHIHTERVIHIPKFRVVTLKLRYFLNITSSNSRIKVKHYSNVPIISKPFSSPSPIRLDEDQGPGLIS